MKIDSHFYLFFCTSFSYTSSQPDNLFFDQLESKADSFLEQSHYWLNGKVINKIPYKTEKVCIDYCSRNDITTSKIKSIAQAILYFIPGVSLKAFAWIGNFSYIKQRNQEVLRSLKEQQEKQSNFIQQGALHSPIIKIKNFGGDKQNQNLIHTIPNELFLFILSLLSNKDRISLAKTCKKTYSDAAHFSCAEAYKLSYSNLINKTLEEKLLQLPFARLPKAWHALFEYYELKEANFSKNFESYDTLTFVRFAGLAYHDIDQQLYYSDIDQQLCSLMKNQPIQRVQLPTGPGLIIRIKDHVLNKEQVFVIAKIKEKWMIVTKSISPGMFLFLNDLRFYEEAPKVLDYLTRLFKGQPCGNFPQVLNNGIEVNYQKKRASDLLKEGPVFCDDNKTPVIQLWPPIN